MGADGQGPSENSRYDLGRQMRLTCSNGYDRDEYPPAESRQGGKGADVRHVPSADNRGAGASQGNQLRPYCNGQRFRIATPRQ